MTNKTNNTTQQNMQHVPQQNGVNPRANDGQAVPTSYKTSSMLLIKPSRVGHLYIK